MKVEKNVRENGALRKFQGERTHGVLSDIYTVLLSCHLLFRLTEKLALEMKSHTPLLQTEVCLSQKWQDSLLRGAAPLPPALWQGEREHLGQKLLLTEVLLFTYPMIEKCLQWGSPELSHGKLSHRESRVRNPCAPHPPFVCSLSLATPVTSAGCFQLLTWCFALCCSVFCLLFFLFWVTGT